MNDRIHELKTNSDIPEDIRESQFNLYRNMLISKSTGEPTMGTETIDHPKRVFDNSNPFWSIHPQQNLYFLQVVQYHMREKLQNDGFLLLNDVYAALGFKRTEEGALSGWAKEKGDFEIELDYDLKNLPLKQDEPIELVFTINSTNVFRDSNKENSK